MRTESREAGVWPKWVTQNEEGREERRAEDRGARHLQRHDAVGVAQLAASLLERGGDRDAHDGGERKIAAEDRAHTDPCGSEARWAERWGWAEGREVGWAWAEVGYAEGSAPSPQTAQSEQTQRGPLGCGAGRGSGRAATCGRQEDGSGEDAGGERGGGEDRRDQRGPTREEEPGRGRATHKAERRTPATARVTPRQVRSRACITPA